MPKLDAIAATVQELCVPGSRPKDIIAAVRERHPGASKKDVVRAAFFALTGEADADLEKARRIQDLALAERTGDETTVSSARPKGSQRKRKAAPGQV